MNDQPALVGRLPWSVETKGLGPITLPDWQERSECAQVPQESDPVAWADMWFAPEGSPEADKAKSICASCPVQTDCLAQAMESQEVWGIWGAVQFEPQDTSLCNASLHEMTSANTRFYYKKGVAYPKCLACDRENARARRAA